jgi:hypothetical protein
MMHDYTGSGNYEEQMVFMDEFVPNSYSDGEPMEWDDHIDLYNKLMKNDRAYLKIENELDEWMYFETADDILNYVLQDGVEEYARESGEKLVIIDGLSLTIPYGLGNTSFHVDGYEIFTMEEKVA